MPKQKPLTSANYAQPTRQHAATYTAFAETQTTTWTEPTGNSDLPWRTIEATGELSEYTATAAATPGTASVIDRELHNLLNPGTIYTWITDITVIWHTWRSDPHGTEASSTSLCMSSGGQTFTHKRNAHESLRTAVEQEHLRGWIRHTGFPHMVA